MRLLRRVPRLAWGLAGRRWQETEDGPGSHAGGGHLWHGTP